MSAPNVLELALDFLLLSTPILAAALVLVGMHRPSSRRDLILKVALLAAVALPLVRAAAQGSASLAKSAPEVFAVAAQRPALSITSTQPGSLSPIDLLLVIWIAVAATAVAGVAVRHFAFMRRIRNRRPLLSAEWIELRNRLGASAPLSILPDGFPSPFTFSGEICIPGWMIGSLDENERTAVLAHELEHVRCGDGRWMFFLDLLCALFFLQPLLWITRARFRALVEERADGAAIRRIGSGIPLAEVLLKVMERMTLGDARADLALLGRRSSLVERVEILLRQQLTGRISPWLISAQLSVVTVAGSLVPGFDLIEREMTLPPLRRASIIAAAPVSVALRPATSAVDALMAVLRTDESPQVRQAAAESLGRRGSRRALSVLRHAADADPNRLVRLSAGDAIERIER